MKYVIVIGDGMADYPLEELGGRTPLEAARKPAIDALSREGMLGLAWNVPQEMAPGSDVAIMSIMGYDPVKKFTGRGPLEAASMGVEAGEDETVFRCNLVSVAGGVLRDYSSGHITTEEARALIAALDAELGSDEARFYPGISYRHILVAKGRFDGVRCFPPHDHVGEPWEEYLPRGAGAEFLVRLMNSSRTVLESHPVNAARAGAGMPPANMVWFWGGGTAPALEGYGERFGVRGSVVSAVDLVRGIGVLVGLDPVAVEGATGLVETNYEGKVGAALAALETGDLAVVHLEGCDEASHMGDAGLKVRGIEELDRRVVRPLLDAAGRFGDYKILLTPDHATPIPVRTHTRDPVPFAIYGSGVAGRPSGLSFTERNASATGVEFREGHRLADFFFGR
ncbi:MAG: cofactor-independent phosphoglycerate mutase [bacterium]